MNRTPPLLKVTRRRADDWRAITFQGGFSMRRTFIDRFTVPTVLALAAAACTSDSALEPVMVESEVSPAFARAVVFPGGCCFYEGDEVRTVVPPAASPKQGRDNFYAFPDGGADGQKGVVGVAPGDTDYHGGQWAFHAVTWNVASYLLTSEAAVLVAENAGDVTITRVPDSDFKCPIQP
jgi:hypothetical protein